MGAMPGKSLGMNDPHRTDPDDETPDQTSTSGAERVLAYLTVLGLPPGALVGIGTGTVAFGGPLLLLGLLTGNAEYVFVPAVFLFIVAAVTTAIACSGEGHETAKPIAAVTTALTVILLWMTVAVQTFG